MAAAAQGRDALLRATITVIAREGLRGFTYRSVAEEAGVAHSLVRHHFGSRDSLIGEALRFAVDESLGATSFLPGADSVAEFAADLVGAVTKDAELQAFQYELLLESRRRPALREHVERYYEAYRQATIAQLKRIGVEDDDFAQLVWLVLDSLVFRQIILNDPASSERTLTQLRTLIAERAEKSS